MKKNVLLLFYAILWIHYYASSQVVTLNDQQDLYRIGKNLELLEDPKKSFTLEEVKKMTFEKSKSDIINKGFTRSAYWLHFTISHQASKEQNPFILEIEFPQSNHLELFYYDVQHQLHTDLYEQNSPKYLPFLNNALKLPIKYGETVEYYMRVSNNRGQQYLPINIWREQAHLRVAERYSWYFGIYFGFLFLVIIYHAFLFWLTRETKYIYIVIYLLFWFFYESFRGYGLYARIFPKSPDNVLLLGFCFNVAISVFLIFYNKVLGFSSIKLFKWIVWGLLFLQILGALVFVLGIYKFIALNLLFSIIGVPFGIFTMVMSTWMWIKGKTNAGFYAMACITVTFFTVLMMVQRAGIIETDNPLILFGSNVGSMFEFVFLTFAVIKTHYETIIEKEKAKYQVQENELRRNIDMKVAKLEGQQSERNRIANQLHDNIGNILIGIKLQVEQIRKKGNENNQSLLESLESEVQEACSQVRFLSHNLLPEKFKEKGIRKSLGDLISNLNEISDIDFALYISENINELSDELLFKIYSISLELLNNTVKHSKAESANLKIVLDDKNITLSMQDDGVGIKPEIVYIKDGGMKTINKRVAEMKGVFEIMEGVEEGTSIKIVLLKSDHV